MFTFKLHLTILKKYVRVVINDLIFFKQTVPHRIMAAKNGALDVILNNLDKEIAAEKRLNDKVCTLP